MEVGWRQCGRHSTAHAAAGASYRRSKTSSGSEAAPRPARRLLGRSGCGLAGERLAASGRAQQASGNPSPSMRWSHVARCTASQRICGAGPTLACRRIASAEDDKICLSGVSNILNPLESRRIAVLHPTCTIVAVPHFVFIASLSVAQARLPRTRLLRVSAASEDYRTKRPEDTRVVVAGSTGYIGRFVVSAVIPRAGPSGNRCWSDDHPMAGRLAVVPQQPRIGLQALCAVPRFPMGSGACFG